MTSPPGQPAPMPAPPPAPIVVAVLGTCEIAGLASGDERSAVTQTQARLLARLSVGPGVVDAGSLAAAVWPADGVPRTARTALANQVSRLRARHGDDLVLTSATGYRLGVPTDVELVAGAVARAEAALTADDLAGARAAAEEALGWCRGQPFVDLDHDPTVSSAQRYAEELRIAAESTRLAAAVAAGGSGWAVAEAERLVALTPYDEHRWALLARALEHTGRRGDALAAIERARRTLREGLGLDPGAELAQLAADLRGDGPARRVVTGPGCLGREEVLARLVGAACEGGLVVVRSEEGGGSTTVLDELARRLRSRGRVVAHTSCATAPDLPLAELTALVDELARADAGPVRGLADRFVATVRAVAAARPAALIVDDLHLAGPSTRAALTAAAGVSGAVVVVSLPPEATLDGISPTADVMLEPLTVSATAAVVAAVRGGQASDVGDWYHQMSGGNPLFLTMLLGADGSWVRESDESRPVGASVADLVRRQTAALGPGVRAVLETIALARAAASEVSRSALVRPDDLASALAAGVLVQDGDDVSFRHGAVAQVHRDAVPPGRRVELHHAIADLLEHRRGPAAAAEHRLASAALDPRGAVRCAAAAAVDAARLGAHLDAARWYAVAAEVEAGEEAAGSSAGLRWRVARGEELRLAGAEEHADVLLGLYEEALASGDATLVTQAATSVLDLGGTTASGRAHEAAERVLSGALAVLDLPEQRARVLGAASLAFSMAGEPDRCRDLFDQAESLATTAASRRAVLPFTYMSLGLPGDVERRHALGSELLALARTDDDAVAAFEAHHLLFSSALQLADGAAVRVHLSRMHELVDTVGDVGRRWAALYAGAAVAHLDGDLATAETLSEEALTTFSPVSPTRAFAVYGAQLLALRLAQGRVAELVEPLQALVVDQPGVPAWRGALALACVEVTPTAAAAHAAAALEDVPLDFSWLAAHLVAGRAAALIGERATAGAYRKRLAPWSGMACWQGTCSYGPVDTTLALLDRALGDQASAAAHAAAARRTADGLAAPVFHADLDSLGL